MAPPENSARWDLGRFAQTLSFFEAVPVLSWLQRMFQSTPPPPVQQFSPGQSALIFDFPTISSINATWGAVDDNVMGGVSDSRITLVPEGADFLGNVSVQNSGGFASVRTRNFDPAIDLSGYQGIELHLRGDGQRYKFLMRSDVGWDSVAFAHSFDTTAGEWITVKIPFTQMVPVFRAKTLKDGTQINLKSVRSLQLMLSKFEYDGLLNPTFRPGAFRMTVRSIGVY
ncbi:MAG: CIA30 family protein [Alkalinema sp. RU_4_3]|nr:CIA30 family protein [Alkalinema sp. RU_4_3]